MVSLSPFLFLLFLSQSLSILASPSLPPSGVPTFLPTSPPPTISPSPRPPSLTSSLSSTSLKSSQISRYIPYIAGIGAITFIVCVCLCYCVIRRRRNRQEAFNNWQKEQEGKRKKSASAGKDPTSATTGDIPTSNARPSIFMATSSSTRNPMAASIGADDGGENGDGVSFRDVYKEQTAEDISYGSGTSSSSSAKTATLTSRKGSIDQFRSPNPLTSSSSSSVGPLPGESNEKRRMSMISRPSFVQLQPSPSPPPPPPPPPPPKAPPLRFSEVMDRRRSGANTTASLPGSPQRNGVGEIEKEREREREGPPKPTMSEMMKKRSSVKMSATGTGTGTAGSITNSNSNANANASGGGGGGQDNAPRRQSVKYEGFGNT